MVSVIVNKLYVVCDGQEDAIFLDIGLNWINYFTYGLMQNFFKISTLLDSCKIMQLCLRDGEVSTDSRKGVKKLPPPRDDQEKLRCMCNVWKLHQ